MALAISLSSTKWRYDSANTVLFEISGLDNLGVIQAGQSEYIRGVVNGAMGDFEYGFKNRSYVDMPVTLRDQKVVPELSWVITDDVIVTEGGTSLLLGGFLTPPGGGYFDTALDPDICSVQARIASAGGISLQNGDLTPVHDYTDPQVAHSMRAIEGGYGEIRENGEVVPIGSHFKWNAYSLDPGMDSMMIQVDHGIVRYYIVRPDNTMILLRTTRSKLLSAPKLEVKLASEGAQLDEIYYTEGEEAGTTIEIAGVLQNFQDWNNDFVISSTGDSIMMANNEPQFTFPNPKRNLRSLSANLAVRQKDERLAFEDFFMWHGNEKEFIFIDKAKTDADGNTTEFWARFASPFGDKSRNQCLSSHSAVITESYRRDYIPPDIYV